MGSQGMEFVFEFGSLSLYQVLFCFLVLVHGNIVLWKYVLKFHMYGNHFEKIRFFVCPNCVDQIVDIAPVHVTPQVGGR